MTVEEKLKTMKEFKEEFLNFPPLAPMTYRELKEEQYRVYAIGSSFARSFNEQEREEIHSRLNDIKKELTFRRNIKTPL